jgi:hypothetical protein
MVKPQYHYTTLCSHLWASGYMHIVTAVCRHGNSNHIPSSVQNDAEIHEGLKLIINKKQIQFIYTYKYFNSSTEKQSAVLALENEIFHVASVTYAVLCTLPSELAVRTLHVAACG